VTRAAGLPFSNYSSISSSFQLSIPPETMSSGTVHAADFYITAQRLLEAAKMHWKWGNVIKKSTTHAHSGPKRTQGVAPRPRSVRMLVSLCCSDSRNVVWWRGVSPEILATIELLSLGLLGDTMISLWKPRSLETCIDLTCHRKPTN
jgi:hypothetical protein